MSQSYVEILAWGEERLVHDGLQWIWQHHRPLTGWHSWMYFRTRAGLLLHMRLKVPPEIRGVLEKLPEYFPEAPEGSSSDGGIGRK